MGAGLVCGASQAAAFALVHAVMAIHLRADQIVSGTAINSSHSVSPATSSSFSPRQSTARTATGDSRGLPDVNIVPSGRFSVTEPDDRLSFVLLIAAHITLSDADRTTYSSVGEHPAPPHRRHSVYGTRYAQSFSRNAGRTRWAYLSIGYLGSFSENMTRVRGFIALAAVIFAKLAPVRASAAACCSVRDGALVPPRPAVGKRVVLFQALPYVLDPDRRRRRDRPIGPTRGGWPSLRQQ